MATSASLVARWARVGITAGFLASIVYPSLVFVPLPDVLAITLACLWGPLLITASIGFYHVLSLHRTTVSAQIGLVSNALAGMLVTAMLLVQIATRQSWTEKITQADSESAQALLRASGAITWSVQLALDVAWDVFISIGTFFLALAAFTHPRFGKVIGSLGMLLAAGLFALNVWTFPTPPADANLIDLGPAVGLWYLAVTIFVVFSIRWIDAETLTLHQESNMKLQSM